MPGRRLQQGRRTFVPPRPEFVLAGRSFVRGKLQPVEVGLDSDGMIVRVGKNLSAPRRHDVGESILLPSATDLHVHFRDPGGPDPAETLTSGTIQAALGGVGLVADMPNTLPPLVRADQITEKVDRALGRLAVEPRRLCCAHSEVGTFPWSLGTPVAFKLYLSPSTGFRHRSHAPRFRLLLESVAASGLPLAVHAEDPNEFQNEPPAHDLPSWIRARPPAAETAGLNELLPAPPALRLHIAHVSLGASIERLRREGHSFEATPHHLLLSGDRGSDTRRKTNPPLRSEALRAELWGRFREGGVPCLASDHAPHAIDQKQREFAEAPSGAPVSRRCSRFFSRRFALRNCPFPSLIAAASERPARWLGLPHGRLAAGHRGNLLVVDFRKTETLTADRLHAPCGWTAFEGFPSVFPQEHYHAGQRIVEGGEFVGSLNGVVRRPEVRTPVEPRHFAISRGER